MKVLIGLILASLISQSAFGACDFKTGVEALPDGRYAYSKECHLHVGTLVKQAAAKDKEITDLHQALDLKTLAFAKQGQELNLKDAEIGRLAKKANEIDALQSKNDRTYFIIGFVSACAAAYAGYEVSKH